MLWRWYAISASRSNGRKRKSAIILVTSKSKKVGRASDMSAVPVWGEPGFLCVAQRMVYRPLLKRRQDLFALQQFRRESVPRRSVGRAPIRTTLRSCAAEPPSLELPPEPTFGNSGAAHRARAIRPARGQREYPRAA